MVKFSIYLNRRTFAMCDPSKDSDQPSHPHNLIRSLLNASRSLGSMLSTMCHAKVLIKPNDAQADRKTSLSAERKYAFSKVAV